MFYLPAHSAGVLGFYLLVHSTGVSERVVANAAMLCQCPAAPSLEVSAQVQHVASELLSRLLARADGVRVHGCWWWGVDSSRGSGRNSLHVAVGEVDAEVADTVSLVVVSPRAHPFGIAVLGRDGRLARVVRQLWCTAPGEFAVEEQVEHRGMKLEPHLVPRIAAGVFNYFYGPRSSRVPQRPQRSEGSLRPRTWMLTLPLNQMTAAARPGSFAELLLDVSLWRCATALHGADNSFHPAYSTVGRPGLAAPWQEDLWTWSLACTVEVVESQVRSCADRPQFSVQKALSQTAPGRGASSVYAVKLHTECMRSNCTPMAPSLSVASSYARRMWRLG